MNQQNAAQVKSRSPVRIFLRILISLLIIAGAVWVILNRQVVYDWAVLRFYEPPAHIEKLNQDMRLTDRGRDIFYVSKPEVHGKTSFAESCKGLGSEGGNVLGCYTGEKIFIFDVEDEKLAGIEQVTAAHEMLHAAYARLSAGEKQRIDDLLKQQQALMLEDSIKKSLSLYEKTEPGQELNELHSMLATEQASILPDLETYYARYFKDRAHVVAYSQSYQSVFSSLTAQRDALLIEIDNLEKSINEDTQNINLKSAQLKTDIESFNTKANNGGFDSQSSLTSQRNEILERQSDINEQIASNTQLRADYASKVAEYNALGLEYNKLNDTIDSSPDTLKETL